MKKAVMLWSGGKDSALALYRSIQKGYQILALVTFGPPNAQFQAHPIKTMKAQANALHMPHCFMEIEEPFDHSYIREFTKLRQKGIEAVITGDINYVNGHPNIIQQCCEVAGLECVLPLWQENRSLLMKELLDGGFDIVLTYVSHPSLNQSWCGRRLTKESIQELSRLPIDLCGENGEYHTMTLNMPLFQKPIELVGT